MTLQSTITFEITLLPNGLIQFLFFFLQSLKAGAIENQHKILRLALLLSWRLELDETKYSQGHYIQCVFVLCERNDELNKRILKYHENTYNKGQIRQSEYFLPRKCGKSTKTSFRCNQSSQGMKLSFQIFIRYCVLIAWKNSNALLVKAKQFHSKWTEVYKSDIWRTSATLRVPQMKDIFPLY